VKRLSEHESDFCGMNKKWKCDFLQAVPVRQCRLCSDWQQ